MVALPGRPPDDEAGTPGRFAPPHQPATARSTGRGRRGAPPAGRAAEGRLEEVRI